MKKYLSLTILLMSTMLSSCLTSNMDDLPEFEAHEITGVQRIEYAYISSEISNSNGQPIVKFVELSKTATIDKDAGTVKIDVTVPAVNANFPQEERDKCSKSNITVMVSLSTAAILRPVDGAPKLGVAGDWSKPNKYEVKAADGSKQIWTIEIVNFTK